MGRVWWLSILLLSVMGATAQVNDTGGLRKEGIEAVRCAPNAAGSLAVSSLRWQVSGKDGWKRAGNTLTSRSVSRVRSFTVEKGGSSWSGNAVGLPVGSVLPAVGIKEREKDAVASAEANPAAGQWGRVNAMLPQGSKFVLSNKLSLEATPVRFLSVSDEKYVLSNRLSPMSGQ